jgi:hypothetical protein
MLDLSARKIHSQSAPANAGTKHLANAAFVAIGVLTYNVYLGFRSVALGREFKRARVQTVRRLLFQKAAKFVRHRRQIFLKIDSAMLAVFIAIREHCTRFMRERYVMPKTS